MQAAYPAAAARDAEAAQAAYRAEAAREAEAAQAAERAEAERGAEEAADPVVPYFERVPDAAARKDAADAAAAVAKSSVAAMGAGTCEPRRSKRHSNRT